MDEDQHPIPKSPAGGESQWLLDVAAGRPIDLARPITESDLELAVRHGLIGVMTDSANQNLRRAALPIFARLKARQKVMEHNLARILSSLHEAHIPATILKGPHLARWAYRNPDHRTYTDIDLLVPAEHVEATLEVLAADAAVSSIPPKTPKADKRNIPMSDPSGVGFNLDLHWDLFSYTQLRGCADGATDWAWEHARLVPDHLLGPIWELPDEARIAFLGTPRGTRPSISVDPFPRPDRGGTEGTRLGCRPGLRRALEFAKHDLHVPPHSPASHRRTG